MNFLNDNRKIVVISYTLKNNKKEQPNVALLMAEDTGLEPAGLLHLTRFPGELLSHSVNPPCYSCIAYKIVIAVHTRPSADKLSAEPALFNCALYRLITIDY